MTENTAPETGASFPASAGPGKSRRYRCSICDKKGRRNKEDRNLAPVCRSCEARMTAEVIERVYGYSPNEPGSATETAGENLIGWLGEVEAALKHARNAIVVAPDRHQNWTARNEIAIAIRCLETALKSEPRPMVPGGSAFCTSSIP